MLRGSRRVRDGADALRPLEGPVDSRRVDLEIVLGVERRLERRLHRVAVPTLVAWGRQDALVPVAYAADFGRSIAGSQVEVINDCGHVLQADQPEALWTVVGKFLAG